MTTAPAPSVAQLLEFQRAWPQHTGRKTAAIHAELGITATRFYQLLARLLPTREALEHDAQLVHQLQRRQRDAARRRGVALMSRRA